MPVISFDMNDLKGLAKLTISAEELAERIPMIGASVEEIEGDTMTVEFFPDRPDLYSVEGVGRALRAFLGAEPGLMTYETKPSGIEFIVDPSVRDVRPYAAGGVIRGVKLNDIGIKSIMDIQEKLHITLGRKRKKVAIGIHDMRDIKPPFTYRAVDPHGIRFVPLASDEEMDLADILERHPKGQEHGNVLEGKKMYPIILDSENNVLSFPPIINGTLTAVTEETTDIFLDVTGTDFRAVKAALNIVATALVERGGRIETVKVIYTEEEGKRVYTLPELEPEEMEVPLDYILSMIGDIRKEDIVPALARMGMDARIAEDSVLVKIPPYRNDILHPVDIVEDVAIGYGYENIGAESPEAFTIGSELKSTVISGKIKEMMIGYGYLEVTTLTLSSEKAQFRMMRRPEKREELTVVKNPITEDHTCLRITLTPSLFEILRKNRHRDLPQRIFEVGYVVENHGKKLHLAGLSIHAKAGFTEIKSLVLSICRDMGLECEIKGTKDPAFIRGRGAVIVVNGKEIGTLGEFHPEVITNFELGYPVIGFEMELDVLTGKE